LTTLAKIAHPAQKSPMQLIASICPTCQTEFSAPESFHQVYCTPRCRVKAKNQRQKAPPLPAYGAEIYENSNPSDEVLTVLAQACVDNPTLVFMFYAVATAWQPPEGVTWLLKPDGSAMLTQA
jgi:hypothetical protein